MTLLARTFRPTDARSWDHREPENGGLPRAAGQAALNSAAPRILDIGGDRTAPLAPFTSVERFRAPSSRRGGKTAAMTRTERVREYRGANAKIAHSGYPEATSTDLRSPSEALGLFISNAVACLDVQR
jgi:hypothetical protein